jgi:hypothetical protein
MLLLSQHFETEKKYKKNAVFVTVKLHAAPNTALENELATAHSQGHDALKSQKKQG